MKILTRDDTDHNTEYVTLADYRELEASAADIVEDFNRASNERDHVQEDRGIRKTSGIGWMMWCLEAEKERDKAKQLLQSASKWMNRIVDRRDDLPIHFFDGFDPRPLAKDIVRNLGNEQGEATPPEPR